MTITQQEIIALAVEAGLAEVTDTAESLPADYVEALANFAALAYQRGVRDERETCIEDVRIVGGQFAAECEDDIRARGQSCQIGCDNLVYERAKTAESQLSDVVLTKSMTREERKEAFLSSRKIETYQDCQSCPPCNNNCNQGRDCPGAKR